MVLVIVMIDGDGHRDHHLRAHRGDDANDGGWHK
jgi:hypothetical protein